MKHYFKIFACLAMGFSLLACVQEQRIEKGGQADGNAEGFAVGGVSKYETKAGAGTGRRIQTNRIALSEPGDPYQVFLVETVEDMDDSFYQSELETKGTPVYTENFKTLFADGFSAVPYYKNGNSYSVYTTDVDKNWCSPDGDYYKFGFYDKWTVDAPQEMVFFMSAPSDITEVSNSTYGYSNLNLTPADGKIAFDYACPDSTDATKQLDLLFTSKKVTRQEYAKIPTLLFYHTMAGVKFKSGNAVREGTTTKNTGETVSLFTNISDIEMTNILSSGHCEVTPNWAYSDSDDNVPGGSGTDVNKSSVASVWTNRANPTTYSVSRLSLVNTDTSLFPESTDFEGKNISTNNDKQLGQLNLNSSNYDKTFMVVPQTTGENVVLSIVYTISVNGNTKKYKKSVAFNGRTWQAGKLYTYTIEANHVAVTVTDTMADTGSGASARSTKSNVVMTNTGNVDAYLRAAIVGNWYDTHGASTAAADDKNKIYYQIVQPWTNSTSEGSFTDFDSTNWEEGTDGFYYYKYKVRPGDSVKHPLFGSYTAGDCPNPLYNSANCHLEMDVLVQAVDANKKAADGSRAIDAYWSVPAGMCTDEFDK